MAFKQPNSVESLCGSPVANLKSGGKMISSDKGSSNYMKEKESVAYMKGSPAKHSMGGTFGREVKHSHNDTNSSSGKKGFFGQDSGTGIYGPNSFFETYRSKQQREAKAKGSSDKGGNTSVNKDIVGPKNSGQSSTNKPVPEVFKGDFSDPNKTAVQALSGSGTTPKANKTTVKKVTKKVPEEVEGSSAAQTAASKLERRAKTAISKQKRKPKTEDGVNAVRDFQANKKKKGKEMSRGEIKEAKKKDKDSGMSRKEVRLNKTKRKAASTRAKTVSKETAAKGGKEAQRLARKTIRLEKKAAKIEGRVKASKIK